jgi:hypothetical protein
MNVKKLKEDLKEAVGSLGMETWEDLRNWCTEVKTDGSYTRPPTLDRRNSLFGPATRGLTKKGTSRWFEPPAIFQHTVMMRSEAIESSGFKGLNPTSCFTLRSLRSP